MNKVLWTSVVGSHAWGMDHPGSDWDYFEVYQAPSVDFLLGIMHDGGHQSQGLFNDGVKWDRASHEVGHHIRQLKKGNINHVIALMAPTVEPGTWDRTFRHRIDGTGTIACVHAELQDIYKNNMAKNIYTSVNGMCVGNLYKYFEKGRKSWLDPTTCERLPSGKLGISKSIMDLRAKKLGQMERVIRFAVDILLDERVVLAPVLIGDGSAQEEQRVRKWLDILDEAWEASELPEWPDAKPYDEYLLRLRKQELCWP